jgi:hypothetical protein
LTRLTSSILHLSHPPKYLADFVEKYLPSSQMAATTRYHLLPEDNRPSLDENTRDSQRLLGAFRDDPTPPKKGFHISGHPTAMARLLVLPLLLATMIIFLIPEPGAALPCDILMIICMVRNVMVLYSHFVSPIVLPIVRVHIEFVGRSPSLPIRKDRPDWLDQRWVQITIDILIWIPLFICLTVVGSGIACYAHVPCSRRELLPGLIMAWIAW